MNTAEALTHSLFIKVVPIINFCDEAHNCSLLLYNLITVHLEAFVISQNTISDSEQIPLSTYNAI